MDIEEAKQFTGYASVEIDGGEPFSSLVIIDMDERRMTFLVPDVIDAVLGGLTSATYGGCVSVSCYFGGDVAMDRSVWGMEGMVVRMLDCALERKMGPRNDEDQMRILQFADALVAHGVNFVSDVFDSVSLTLTDMDLLVGSPPEIWNPYGFLDPAPAVCPEKNEKITVTLAHEEVQRLHWEIDGGDNALTVNILRDTRVGGGSAYRGRELFVPSRSIWITADKPLSHYALMKQAIDPLRALATLLLGADVTPGALKFGFDGGRRWPSEAVHRGWAYYRSESAPSYDRRSRAVSKEGILYDAMPHSGEFFGAYAELRVPILQITNDLAAPLFHVTGMRMVEAASALQGAVRYFKGQEVGLSKAIRIASERCLGNPLGAEMKELICRERNAYGHGDTRKMREDMSAGKMFEGEHLMLNLAIEYLLREVGLPEDIVLRARADEMPFAMLYE